MKKYWSLLAVLFVMVMLCTGTVLSNETCEYATDGTECEIWYFYDNEFHWQACVNHKDVYGNDAKISEAEEHNFEEGKCSVCDAKETKGTSAERIFNGAYAIACCTACPHSCAATAAAATLHEL